MLDYQIAWIVFGLVAALTWIAAWSFTKWREAAVQAGVEREAAGHHFRAMRAALAREAEARRDLARLAQARPDQAADAIRLSARLSSVPVMSAGVIALVEELQRTSAADRDLDPADAAKSLSLAVAGDIAVQAIVRRVIQAVDEASLDLDLDAAASAAAAALEGGEPAPIEDVLAALGDVKRIPIRSLEDVARDARRDRIFRAQAASAPRADELPRPDLPEGAAIDVATFRDRAPRYMVDPTLPSLSLLSGGIRPDEAVLEMDGSWTLRRKEAPAGQTWCGWSPLEERGLSDDDMIARGFNVDMMRAGHALAAIPGRGGSSPIVIPPIAQTWTAGRADCEECGKWEGEPVCYRGCAPGVTAGKDVA